MLNVANKLLGTNLDDDTLIIGTSGRYEFKNKGIDVFLESLNRLNRDKTCIRMYWHSSMYPVGWEIPVRICRRD